VIAWLIGPWRSATSDQATTGPGSTSSALLLDDVAIRFPETATKAFKLDEQLLEPISAGTDEERTP
jgi:hypothetical protein